MTSITSKFILIVMMFLALNAGAYYVMFNNIYQQELKVQAQTIVSNVEAFGSWVAKSGRIWVKDDSTSFLGRKALFDEVGDVHTFYSKNPALAQREFSEAVAESDSPAKFRMTSLNYMNVLNRPDAFESASMQKMLDEGIDELWQTVPGKYRYVQAVYHKESCIACHGNAKDAPQDVIENYGSIRGYGFKTGDLAGVISVTIATNSTKERLLKVVDLKVIGLLLSSVLLAWWFIQTKIVNPIGRVTQTAEKLSKGLDVKMDVSQIKNGSRDETEQLMASLLRLQDRYRYIQSRLDTFKSKIRKK